MIQEHLIIDDENLTKRAFDSKNINYEISDGNVLIKPDGLQQIKSLLRIIKDGVVKTGLLGREGITGDFEEI